MFRRDPSGVEQMFEGQDLESDLASSLFAAPQKDGPTLSAGLSRGPLAAALVEAGVTRRGELVGRIVNGRAD